MSIENQSLLSPSLWSAGKRNSSIESVRSESRNFHHRLINRSVQLLLNKRSSLISNEIKLKKLKEKEEIINRKLQKRQEKDILAKHIENVLGIKLSRIFVRSSNIDEIWDKGYMIFQMKRKYRAVKYISNWWKKTIINRKIREIKLKNHMAASFIQRNWKKFKKQKLLKSIFDAKKKAAITIQKFYRGYKIRSEYKTIILKIHMKKIFQYFELQKDTLRAKAFESLQQIWIKFKAKSFFLKKYNPLRLKPKTNSYMGTKEINIFQPAEGLSPTQPIRNNTRHYTFPKRNYVSKPTSLQRKHSP
ncbi:unnamed protein product [Blepharisma stoltei]|uniref:Uncharacterized protein n=1 Tax=Blepharisma stoltei TaxID=1481888 RepID=A0AAU9J6C5_9CILI|nr:unnamed protein product [Blepharisma stoltei]